MNGEKLIYNYKLIKKVGNMLLSTFFIYFTKNNFGKRILSKICVANLIIVNFRKHLPDGKI